MLLAVLAARGSAPLAAPPEWRSMPAVLVMVQDHGCPYCARWEAEVQRSYELSEEGKFAPLAKRVRGHPDVSEIRNIVYSPTFVLLSYGEEVGRILGYQGAELFWMQLEPLMLKAGFKGARAAR